LRGSLANPIRLNRLHRDAKAGQSGPDFG